MFSCALKNKDKNKLIWERREVKDVKATGIVRRIDDLGRVVIPKEIRRTLKIREGDPLEIFVDREGEVILKKYSPIKELGTFSQEYTDALFESLNKTILISDRDEFIAASGSKTKDYLTKSISSVIERVMEEREALSKDSFVALEIVNDQPPISASYLIQPIVSNGDPVGSIIIFSTENVVSNEEKLTLEVAANFLGKQME